MQNALEKLRNQLQHQAAWGAGETNTVVNPLSKSRGVSGKKGGGMSQSERTRFKTLETN